MEKTPVWKMAGFVFLACVLLIAVFTLLGGGGGFVNLVANIGSLALFILVVSGGFRLVKKAFSS